jgi:hypothetical protein
MSTRHAGRCSVILFAIRTFSHNTWRAAGGMLNAASTRVDPTPNTDPVGARNLDRRLGIMRREGVTVVTRPLRYHWDWGHPGQRLPAPGPGVPSRHVMLSPWMRPQEKGIDLVIGLDVVEFLLTRVCDVAIIVSLDRDLFEIPQAIQNLSRLIARPVRLEAAVPVPDGQKQPKILPRFSFTHQITRQVFQRIRDDTNYTVDDSAWSAPQVPKTIAP